MNGGTEVVEAKYDDGCPPTTMTTVTTTTTITTTTTTMTTVTTEHYECHCLYDGDTLPEESWTAAGKPLYGTYCANWDSLPGTNGHENDSKCPPSKKIPSRLQFYEFTMVLCERWLHGCLARTVGRGRRRGIQLRHVRRTRLQCGCMGRRSLSCWGWGRARPRKKHAIVYLKVRLCRKRAQHIMGIPCTAPIVKKSGTKCQELKITLLDKRKIASEQRGSSVQKSVTGDTRVGALSRKVVMVWKKMK